MEEAGSLKKGVHSTGMGRPYSETVGRIGNCTVGIFVAQALADRSDPDAPPARLGLYQGTSRRSQTDTSTNGSMVLVAVVVRARSRSYIR